MKTNREQQAIDELGSTEVSHKLSVTISLFFILSIAVIPVIQLGKIKLPEIPREEGLLRSNQNLISSFKKFENFIIDSFPLNHLRPKLQTALVSLGEGNNQVIIGKDEWLFHKESTDFLLKGTFEVESVKEVILDFNHQLSKRGIELILMPVPVKAIVHSEKLFHDGSLLKNPYYQQLINELEIKVFDSTKILYEAKNTQSYLKSDTHWTPHAMEEVAKKLAQLIKPHSSTNNLLKPISNEVINQGDIKRQLNISQSKNEQVKTNQIYTNNGSLWAPNLKSDVLLLGDSFTNIYSLQSMGWGFSAGLAEHISNNLGKSIDCIAINNGGANETRQELARQYANGIDRLKGKKTLIWQFSMRDLITKKWQKIKLGRKKVLESTFLKINGEVNIRGTIAARSSSPAPDRVTYKDHIFSIHLKNINGENKEAVIYVQGMKDGKLTQAALWRIGQEISLKVEPWSDRSGISRSELEDESLLLELPLWGVPD